MTNQTIEKIWSRATRSAAIHEAVLLIENGGGEFSAGYGYGGMDIDSPLLMASITKLFTTTCIIILQERGQLSLDDSITKYLDKSLLEGLHVFKSKDYTDTITISDLLFHISGLPDWFEGGKDVLKQDFQDFGYTFEEMLLKTKSMKPRFAPRTGKKACYSDSNFDILSEIIEVVAKSPLNEVFKSLIFQLLGLDNTYLPTSADDFIPKVYNGKNAIHRPQFMISNRGSGGAVTTARELMIFTKAFFGGALFDESIFEKLSVYRNLMFPFTGIRYGGGYMQFPLNGLNTMFRGSGELIGHSGLSASFAFYYPQKDLYFVGTLNQLNPALPFRLLSKLSVGVE